ncbi:MAG: transaldolase [Candidatus Ratteibacteria bacterium]|nr:transaldolase [Candidatus Ratteibacteria bacterium]
MSKLHELKKAGQSAWYDNITRDLLLSGGLKKLIDNGILGLTSNPTIFQKAFSSSPLYKNQLEEFKAKKASTLEAYEKLVFKDILDAADCFECVYGSTNKVDGYVSIEVSPHSAYDTKGTIEEAEKTFKTLSCPNIMIKVPATKEGVTAIKELIAAGININATLIFSVTHYEQTANAYMEGLEKRAAQGKDLSNVHSVASVFISRVDSDIDKVLDAKGNKALRGLAAVANAKLIYKKYKDIFYSERFKKLQAKGANIQRPLWASTSSKDPAYSKIKYVDELIGPNTVNTMPGETMEAFLQDGKVKKASVEENLEGAKKAIADLKKEGIDVNAVCDKLQTVGVQKFIESCDSMLDSISKSIL